MRATMTTGSSKWRLTSSPTCFWCYQWHRGRTERQRKFEDDEGLPIETTASTRKDYPCGQALAAPAHSRNQPCCYLGKSHPDSLCLGAEYPHHHALPIFRMTMSPNSTIAS